MHRLLTDHPVYKQAVEDVARIKGAQARHQQQTAREAAEYLAAADAYQADAVAALQAGFEAPERPTPPEVDHELVRQLTEASVESGAILRAAERKLAPALLPLLEARAQEIEETIREAADAMRGLAREASELRVTVAAQRAAAELPPLTDQRVVTVDRLFEVVLRGDRLLDAKSPTPAQFDGDAPRGSATIVSFASLVGRR